MTYTVTLAKLATTTELQVVAAFESWQAGKLTQEEFLAVAAAFLSAAGNVATGLADLALAAFLTVDIGKAVPTLGLIPAEVDHRPTLAAIIAAGAQDYAPALGVEARSVTLATAQDAYGEAMTKRHVPGWTRVLNGGACPLCADLAGDVLPGTAPMYHHKGCGCTQRPVFEF